MKVILFEVLAVTLLLADVLPGSCVSDQADLLVPEGSPDLDAVADTGSQDLTPATVTTDSVIRRGQHGQGQRPTQSRPSSHPQIAQGHNQYRPQQHANRPQQGHAGYPQGYPIQGYPVQGYPQGYPVTVAGIPAVYPSVPVYYPGSGVVIGSLGPPSLYPTYPTVVGTGGVEIIPVGGLGGGLGNSVVVIPTARKTLPSPATAAA